MLYLKSLLGQKYILLAQSKEDTVKHELYLF